MSSLEAVPFLSEREPITPSSPIFKSQPFSFQSSALKFGGLLVYTILISVVSIQIFREGQNECRALTKDFIGNYIEYKPKRFISSAESKYSGKPNFEKDAAWRQLLGQQLIRLTSSEIRRNGISTLPSQESPGFIATTTFWHELHCIWYLRETLYQDHHHPNISAEMAQPRVTHSGARATPKKKSRRPPLLTQVQVAELVEFVCASSTNRRMSFVKLAEVLDFRVKKQAIRTALLREGFHCRLAMRKPSITEKN
ncbi:hypothetical protein G7Y89_g15818 [Cudoniella acicularis]|uniref:Uncharacterized protein n=1 Tax=Cudoniella acicularis TaxID=354080 RepID=A0A8H4QFF2_9HELO|nr:hypothetical protein G7Y89_g15818 [Cudoniella acicularis]